MKLVGYVRVSSKNQEDNTSLDDQKRRIRAYCEAFNHELVEIFEEVQSGGTMGDRPQFNQAMEMVKESADGIVAIKLDRIARNCKDVLILVDDVLQPANKALVLLDLNVDTSTPTGKMILTMMAAVAELEKAQINERCRNGKKAKAANGGYVHGTPGYGFDAVDKELQPNESEQQVIEVIRRHRKSGKSFQQVADFLNSQGIQTKRGGQWQAMTVKRVCDRLKSEKSAA